jgi:adenosine deaminase
MTPAGRVELHTHLEGSVTPARLILLAEKYGQPGLPAACLNADGTAYRFAGFQGFLVLFKDVTSILRTPADFHAITCDLGGQLAADGVEYAEVTISYGVLQRRDIDPLPVQEALAEAAAEVRENHGVKLRWIPDAVRQWGPAAAWRAWEAAARAGRTLGVVGFGLGGDETAGPAAEFADLFHEVKTEGFGVTIHAGEVPDMGSGAVESIRQAVIDCRADRIGHGLAAARDPLLLAELAARAIFVEMCPGSNVRTGGITEWGEHPLRAFLEAGVPCCLNTDDRTLFGLDLAGEYDRARELLSLSEAEYRSMQKAARQAAFESS